jgi:hypothetical protein
VASALPFHLPYAISRVVAFAAGSTIILAGGLDSAGSVATVLSVDPSNGSAVVVGRLASPVHDAAGATAGGLPTVFGGGGLAPERGVQRITPGVAELVGTLPAPRADLGAVEFGGAAIIVGGGTTARLERDILSTMDGVTFRVIGTLRYGTRYPAVAVTSDTILVIGGTDGSHDLTVIQAIDPTTGVVHVIGNLPHGLSHAAAFTLDGRVLVAGGRTAGRAQDVIWEIDPKTGAATLVGHLPVGVSDASAVVINGVGYLLGGETDRFEAFVTAIRFD